VRVPAEAASGDAKAILRFRDAKEMVPLTMDFEVK
jgi:hypothetical protein